MNNDIENSVYRMAQIHHWATILIVGSVASGIAGHYGKMKNSGAFLVGLGAGIATYYADPFSFRKMKADKLASIK